MGFFFITNMYRFEYCCVCPDGFGGLNCHLSGCGGNLTSQETDQLITMPDEADPLIGCVWNISSPEGSRINLTVKEFLNQRVCSFFNLRIWSGLFQSFASFLMCLSVIHDVMKTRFSDACYIKPEGYSVLTKDMS